MSKSHILLKYSIVFIISYLSCTANPLGPEYYNDGSFYYSSNRKINIYPSKSVMVLKFKENVSRNEAEEIIKNYHVRIYSELFSNDVDIETLINDNQTIIIKIIRNKSSATNYITKYPRTNNLTRLGNHPEVQYCLQSYSVDGSQDKCSRIFLTDRIVFKVATDSASISSLIEKYSLKHIPKKYLGQNVFLYELTASSPKGPLEIANELYEEQNILWAHPDFLSYSCTE